MRCRSSALPFVLVESDDRRVQQARAAGRSGDLRRRQPAGRARGGGHPARASHPGDGPGVSRRSQHRQRPARQLRPDLPIIARADGPDAVRALYALGIQEVTSPEFEAAIEMTRQALMHFNVPAHDVLQRRQRDPPRAL